MHWSSYYKAIEQGKFQWWQIVKKLVALLAELFSSNENFILAIDDTIVTRSSEKAPAAAVHHNHANKKNIKRYVLGQLFVAIFFIVYDKLGRPQALPLSLFLAEKGGNSSKIRIARFLVKSVWRWLKAKKKNIVMLCDSWYSKRTLFEPLSQLGIQCIGQVRRDTAIFLPPEPPAGRGRPRKYGRKIDISDFYNMVQERQFKTVAYGREGVFHYHEFQALVRFLKGRLCKAVWCRFETKNGTSNWKLLIATNPNLTGEEVIKFYTARWSVEPAFNTIKNSVGLNDAWQQKKETHAKWRCILCVAHCISALASISFGERLAEIAPIGWRRNQPMTATWAAYALRSFFRYFSVSTNWNRKRQKITLPD